MLCVLRPHLFLPFAVALRGFTGARLAASNRSGRNTRGRVVLQFLDREAWHHYAAMATQARLQDDFIPTLSLVFRLLILRQAIWLRGFYNQESQCEAYVLGDSARQIRAREYQMRRLGIEKEAMSGHRFRPAAPPILAEVLGVHPDCDPSRRAYNRTAHLAKRRKMTQDWSNYLDKLKSECREDWPV